MAKVAKQRGRKKRFNFDVSRISPDKAAELGIKIPEGDSEEYLSPNDIGKILNVTGEAVKQWIYTNRLQAVKLGNGYWKVKKKDLVAFINNRNNYGRRKVLIVAPANNLFAPIIEALGHEAVGIANYADAVLKVSNMTPNLVIIATDAKDLRPWDIAAKIRSVRGLRHCAILFAAEKAWSDEETEKALKFKAEGAIIGSEVEGMTTEIKRILGGA